MVRPQRRQLILVSVLSTLRMSSPALVISVWRTRTSGMSSGIEMSGGLGIGIVHLFSSATPLDSASFRREMQLLYLGASTASPGEPKIIKLSSVRKILFCVITHLT